SLRQFIQIKALENEKNGIRNAAFQFNGKDLTPTYRLLYDTVGTSFALAIAQNCGLKHNVLQVARDFVDKKSLDLDKLAKRLQKKLRKIDRWEIKLAKERKEFKINVAKFNTDFQDFQAKKRLGLEKVIDEEMQELKDLRKKIENELYELRKQGKESKKGMIHELLSVQGKLEEKLSENIDEKDCNRTTEQFFAGDEVYLLPFKSYGVVEKVKNKQAFVNSEGKSIWLSFKDLEKSSHLENETISTVHVPAMRVKPQINLVGFRLPDALGMLETYLDSAVLSGWDEITIIHGKGSGILKKGIREYLKTSFADYSIRDGLLTEGGAGVTILVLKK
ncbi:Smr/MutS family protein, partial [Candidatus Riflebacteria bacterium]